MEAITKVIKKIINEMVKVLFILKMEVIIKKIIIILIK
jgi:hypothetical protein